MFSLYQRREPVAKSLFYVQPLLVQLCEMTAGPILRGTSAVRHSQASRHSLGALDLFLASGSLLKRSAHAGTPAFESSHRCW